MKSLKNSRFYRYHIYFCKANGAETGCEMMNDHPCVALNDNGSTIMVAMITTAEGRPKYTNDHPLDVIIEEATGRKSCILLNQITSVDPSRLLPWAGAGTGILKQDESLLLQKKLDALILGLREADPEKDQPTPIQTE